MADRAPTDERAATAWMWSAAVGALAGAMVLLYSFLWMPVVHNAHGWLVPGDTWILTEPARYVADGALGYLYTPRNGYYALPLPAILMAPAQWVSDHYTLLSGYPFPVPKPSAWLVIGPWEMLAGIPALHAMRRLAASFGLRRARLGVLQVLLAAVVVVPCELWSHPEDVLALAFVLYGIRAMRAEEHTRAALYLAVAVCCKQWAVVAIPFLLVGVAPGRRLRTLATSAAPAVLLAAFPLAVDWADTSRALLFPTFPEHLRTGHSSPLLPLFVAVAGSHGSMIGRVLEVLAAPVVAIALRKRPEPVQLIGLGGVLMVRMVMEPVMFAYYLAPGLALFVFAVLAANRRVPWGLLGWELVLVAWAQLGTPRTWWWWSGALTIVAVISVTVWRELRSRPAESLGLAPIEGRAGHLSPAAMTA